MFKTNQSNMLAIALLICMYVVFSSASELNLGTPEKQSESVVENISWTIPPATVKTIVLDSYLGIWYQAYASIVPNTTYEKDSYCVRANYTYINSTSFHVLNSENVGSPSGTLKEGGAISTLPNAAEPGKWILKFEGPHPYVGFYWIIKLGPVDATTNKYDYSVVSVPFGTTVFILARDISTFKTKYESALLAELESEGFKYFWNKPLPTYQGAGCKYSS